MENKNELLKKIKELANRGVDGEKDNAQRLLKQLMDKHGITDEDMESSDIINKVYDFPKPEKLFWQILSTVSPKDPDYVFLSGKKKMVIRLTASEHVDFEIKLHFYLALFKKEWKFIEENFLTSFIIANSLWSIRPTSPVIGESTKDE